MSLYPRHWGSNPPALVTVEFVKVVLAPSSNLIEWCLSTVAGWEGLDPNKHHQFQETENQSETDDVYIYIFPSIRLRSLCV